MIQDTLAKLEKRLQNASIEPQNKTKLLKLLSELQIEIQELSKTKKEQSDKRGF